MKTRVPLTILLMSFGCATRDVRADDPLPFHLAVIPFEISAGLPQPESEGTQAEVELGLDDESVSAAIATRLERNFTRATLLPYPDGIPDGATDESVPSDAYWLSAARNAGADLVLSGILEYSPAVRTEINEKFWLNLPLFLIGGPMSWFVNDRSYDLNVRLSVSIYDARIAMESGATALSASRAELAQVNVELTHVAFDLIDRAKTQHYFAAILCPPGLLAKNTSRVHERLAEDVTTVITEELGTRVQDHQVRVQVVQGGQNADFFPEELAVIEGPSGPELHASLVLELGRSGNELRDYEIELDDGTVIAHEFEAGRLDETSIRRRRMVYDVVEALPASASRGVVRFRATDRSREANTRSFTVAGHATASTAGTKR